MTRQEVPGLAVRFTRLYHRGHLFDNHPSHCGEKRNQEGEGVGTTYFLVNALGQ